MVCLAAVRLFEDASLFDWSGASLGSVAVEGDVKHAGETVRVDSFEAMEVVPHNLTV